MAALIARHLLQLTDDSTAEFGGTISQAHTNGSATAVEQATEPALDTGFWPHETAGLVVCGIVAWLAAIISIYQVRRCSSARACQQSLRSCLPKI